MGPSARTIVELNIRYYRGLLKTEADQSKRQTIAKLLAEEEERLGKLAAAQSRAKLTTRRVDDEGQEGLS